MDEIINTITLFATLLLFVGFLYSVYYGFQKHVLWGLGMIFLPGVSHLLLLVLDRGSRKSWGKLMLAIVSAWFILSVGVAVPAFGLIFLAVAIGLSLWKSSLITWIIPTLPVKKSALRSFQFLANSVSKGGESVSIGEYELDPVRFQETLLMGDEYWQRLGQKPSVRRIQKKLKNTDAGRALTSFYSKHFRHMTSMPVLALLKDERLELFTEMYTDKYSLSSSDAIALLLYIDNESDYHDYADAFSELTPSTVENLLQQIVLHDIYSGISSKEDFIRRLLLDKGFSKKEIRGFSKLYDSTKRKLKLQHLSATLESEQVDSQRFRNIEESMKYFHQTENINSRISEHLDTDLNNYQIVPQDHSRDSRIDRHYRAHFSYTLSRAFDGHCCKCGEGMGQLEFDHFWLPKSSGGNFAMRSRKGTYVNNCIPLCRTCNSSKGNRDYRSFFGSEELIEVIKRSQSVNQYINEHMVEFEDPDFPTRAY